MFIITQINKPQSSADQTPKFTLAAAYCLHCHLSMFCRVNQHQFIAKRHLKLMETHLVGGFNHLEKYDFVNGKDDIPYIMVKIILKCLKPPTSHDVPTIVPPLSHVFSSIFLDLLQGFPKNNTSSLNRFPSHGGFPIGKIKNHRLNKTQYPLVN